MRKVAHISDLHFGRITPQVLPALVTAIRAAAPDVVVVSGDLTQRAKAEEFAQAKAFLDTLPKPQIIVPGNHDVPLYDVLRRWLSPLGRFRRYITDDPQPFYADDEIAVVGINTARSWTFKDGRINAQQVAQACERFTSLPPVVARLVVTHHPFALDKSETDSLVGRADMALESFVRCGVDAILSGHMHTSHTLFSADHYVDRARSCLLIQAGTATSSRQRGERNAFNIIEISGDALNITKHILNEATGAFVGDIAESFARSTTGWMRAVPETAIRPPIVNKIQISAVNRR